MTIDSNLKIRTILKRKMLDKNITTKDLGKRLGISSKRTKSTMNALKIVKSQVFFEICEVLDIKEIKDLFPPKPDNL